MPDAKTFKEDSKLKRFPLVATALDFLWTLPWAVVPFSWVAFLTFPFWGGLFLLAMFVAFILDIFISGNAKEG